MPGNRQAPHRGKQRFPRQQTKRRFEPNLHRHRFYSEAEKRFVTLRVSAKGMRIIDKLGVDGVLAQIRARGERV